MPLFWKQKAFKAAAILKAEGVQESDVLQAKGEAQARIINAESEATSRMKIAQAEAEAIKMSKNAIPNGDPMPYLIAHAIYQSFARNDAR